MKEKIVEYGTKHPVTIESADKNLIVCIADDINEGFLLAFHGIEKLPQKGDKGTIVFERNNRRGFWQYYPNNKQQ